MSGKSPEIELARAYEVSSTKGKYRVLVDRIWPRGIKKADLALDDWLKDIAPSDKLRKWFDHDPERWDEFCKRYQTELSEKQELVDQLLEAAQDQPLLLIFGARDIEHNNAVALRQCLEEQAGA